MIAPAWSLLSAESLSSLLTLGRSLPDAIHVADTISEADVWAVPMMVAARLMIERGQANGGLTLTKAGALSRADVRVLFDGVAWPDFDKETVLAVNKVLNEDDDLPALFARVVAQEAKLLRRYKGRLLATKRASELMQPERVPGLFRALFETALYRVNLAFFDRLPAEHWPQTHMGVVLWSLSVAAHHWSGHDDLLVACTMSDEGLAAAASDFPAFAMITRVLRPLTWFGLLECQDQEDDSLPQWHRPRLYRKTPLFDLVLSFDVSVEVSTVALQ